MAKAVAKSKKTGCSEICSEIKAIGPAQGRRRGPRARKALKKAPAKPVAKVRKRRQEGCRSGKPAAEAVKSGKWVYTFGDGKAEGKAGLRDLLGGKGANLAEMANLGLPVPPGFTIPTSVCTYFYAHDKSYPEGIEGAGREGARIMSAS